MGCRGKMPTIDTEWKSWLQTVYMAWSTLFQTRVHTHITHARTRVRRHTHTPVQMVASGKLEGRVGRIEEGI